MAAVRTFLILDDDEDNRFLTAHALRKAFPGARVFEAETIPNAVSIAQNEAVDGVITDHHLGSGDGVQFMQQLTASGIRCPVVMITASSDPAVYQRAREAGARAVFQGTGADHITYFREQLGEA